MAYYAVINGVEKEVSEAEWQASRGTSQIGSQFWMNSGYKGSEPSLEVKAAASDAQYASDWMTTYAKTLVNAGVPVQNAVAEIANRPVQESSLKIFEAVPAISPAGAVAQRIAEAGGYTQWAQNMGVVVAQPDKYNDPTSILAPPSPVSGAGAGTIDPIQAIVAATPFSGAGSGWSGGSTDGTTTTSTGLLSQLGIIPVVIIAAVFVVLAYLAVKATGRGRSASA